MNATPKDLRMMHGTEPAAGVLAVWVRVQRSQVTRNLAILRVRTGCRLLLVARVCWVHPEKVDVG
jgi:hypothetical protein